MGGGESREEPKKDLNLPGQGIINNESAFLFILFTVQLGYSVDGLLSTSPHTLKFFVKFPVYNVKNKFCSITQPS